MVVILKVGIIENYVGDFHSQNWEGVISSCAKIAYIRFGLFFEHLILATLI